MKEEQDLKNLRREMRARGIEETHTEVEVERDMRQRGNQEKSLREEIEISPGIEMKDKTEKEDKIDMTDKKRWKTEDIEKEHQAETGLEEDL